MASPVGLGVGDIVKACQQIYILCQRYKGAHAEFDEISAKAESTTVVLERLDDENEVKGNLVERAGDQAFAQLQRNLESLRQDAQKLSSLIKKYDDIHHDGPGRRLLWALRVSGDLTDLRRRIGYHEQTLQLWYMTLVYGSLRRLETGQEKIICALGKVPKYTLDDIIDRLRRGDISKLEHELTKCGVSKKDIAENINTAVEYVTSPPIERAKMDSEVRQSRARASAVSDFPPFDGPMLEKGSARKRHGSRNKDEIAYLKSPTQGATILVGDYSDGAKESKNGTRLQRSKSTSSRPKHEHGRYNDAQAEVIIASSKPSSQREKERKIGKSYIVIDKPRSRRVSEAPKPTVPPSPLLEVPSATYTSGSASSSGVSSNGRTEKTYEQMRPSHRRTRSEDVRRREREEGDKVIVVEEVRSRSRQRGKDSGSRDSSTHSYVRVRDDSSRGPASPKIDDRGREYRRIVVQRLDRIDSIPLDEDGNPVDKKKP